MSDASRYSRYFYHCFPQWFGTTNEQDTPSREAAVATLRLMFRWGLLLTPETVVFHGEPTMGDDIKPIRIGQRRICFTELAPHEVPDHADAFGPLALEFDQDSLRKLGAMPVFYIPQALSHDPQEDRLALVGQTFVHRLSETYRILTNLADIESKSRDYPPHELVPLEPKKLSDLVHIPAQILQSMLAGLTVETQPLREQASAINFLSRLFYPADGAPVSRVAGDDTRLGYYREREWRILANVWFADWRQDQQPSQESANEIARLVEGSFSPYVRKRIDDGAAFVGACRILVHVANRPVMAFVRRILAPVCLKEDVQRLCDEFGFTGSVVSY